MKKVSKDTISIIIPVHNAAHFLQRCFDSILAQTYKNLEVIIIENGSTDNSASLCKEFKHSCPFPTKFHQLPKANVSAARNLGLKKAEGGWVTFLDSDDTLDPKFCEIMHTTAVSHKTNYICCGYNRISNGSHKAINANQRTIKLSSEEYLYRLLNVQNGYGFVHMKLIKSTLAKKATFDESLIVAEDALYNIELTKHIKQAVIIHQPLYNYHINSNSTVHQFRADYPSIYLTSSKHIKTYLEKTYPKNPKIRTYTANFVAYHVLLILVNYCAHPKNPHPLDSLRSVLSEPTFDEAIKNSTYENLSATRRIPLWMLKNHSYHLAILVGKLRLKKNGVYQ